MELARSWFRSPSPSPPGELRALFSSHPRLTDLELLSGTPELVTPLPERGEGRNHDLHLICRTANEQVTVCVEAKADEPFGNETIGEYWSRSMARRDQGVRTRAPERIEALLSMVDSEGNTSESEWKAIRYQLLTAVCGTVIQAQIDNSDVAALVIHEFKTGQTIEEKHHQNQLELDYLVSLLAGTTVTVEAEKIFGPYKIGICGLIIGKFTTFIANS